MDGSGLRDELERVQRMPHHTAGQIRAKLAAAGELRERVLRDGSADDGRLLQHIIEPLSMYTEADLQQLETDEREGRLFTREEKRAIRNGTASDELLQRYRRHHSTVY